uniref:PHD zinc finger protein n=1 Tax=Amorphochlora amoebiformis TaxID=1561963 RepID=A0A0H5BLD7_9EUKA|nr:PHD zinc finger protein [Amorphochlora amoebiformis]
MAMVKHHSDLILCLKLQGSGIGKLCDQCNAIKLGEGKCPICDSYVRPTCLVRICNDCNYGSYKEKCIICGKLGVSDAYYCRECVILEKNVILNLKQDGCPRILNVGSSRADLFYDKKKYSVKDLKNNNH